MCTLQEAVLTVLAHFSNKERVFQGNVEAPSRDANVLDVPALQPHFVHQLLSCVFINDLLDLKLRSCALSGLFGWWGWCIGSCLRFDPHVCVNFFVGVLLFFGWLQALGTRRLEPSESPLDHLFVLHLHGLGSVTLITVVAHREQLPRAATGHLQDFTDGFAVHGLLVVGGLVESTAEGAQRHQLLNTHHQELAISKPHDPAGAFSCSAPAHHPPIHNAAWPPGEALKFPPHQTPAPQCQSPGRPPTPAHRWLLWWCSCPQHLTPRAQVWWPQWGMQVWWAAALQEGWPPPPSETPGFLPQHSLL